MGERQQGVDWAMEGGKAARVLLVENGGSSGLVASLLRECRYDVTACSSGDATIELVDARPQDYDVVLADATDSCCLKLLQRCRANSLFPPVVVMSDQEGSAVVLEFLRLGAADYLLQPVRKNELNNLWQHAWRRSTLQSRAAPSTNPQARTSTTARGDHGGASPDRNSAGAGSNNNTNEPSPRSRPGGSTKAADGGDDGCGENRQSSGGSGPTAGNDADMAAENADGKSSGSQGENPWQGRARKQHADPMTAPGCQQQLDGVEVAHPTTSAPALIRPRAGRTSLGASSLDVLDAIGSPSEECKGESVQGGGGGYRFDTRRQGRREVGGRDEEGVHAEEGEAAGGGVKTCRRAFDGRKHPEAGHEEGSRKRKGESAAAGAKKADGRRRHLDEEDDADISEGAREAAMTSAMGEECDDSEVTRGAAEALAALMGCRGGGQDGTNHNSTTSRRHAVAAPPRHRHRLLSPTGSDEGSGSAANIPVAAQGASGSGAPSSWRHAPQQSQDSGETTSLQQGDESTEDKVSTEQKTLGENASVPGSSHRLTSRGTSNLAAGSKYPSAGGQHAERLAVRASSGWTGLQGYPYVGGRGGPDASWRGGGSPTADAGVLHDPRLQAAGQGGGVPLGHSETRSAFSRYGPILGGGVCAAVAFGDGGAVGGGRQARQVSLVHPQASPCNRGEGGAGGHLTKWSLQGKDAGVADRDGSKGGFRSIFSSSSSGGADVGVGRVSPGECRGASAGVVCGVGGARSAFRASLGRRASLEVGSTRAECGSSRAECADSNESRPGADRAGVDGGANGASAACIAAVIKEECAGRGEEDSGSGQSTAAMAASRDRDGSPGAVDREGGPEERGKDSSHGLAGHGDTRQAAAGGAPSASPRLDRTGGHGNVTSGGGHQRESEDACSGGGSTHASASAGGDHHKVHQGQHQQGPGDHGPRGAFGGAGGHWVPGRPVSSSGMVHAMDVPGSDASSRPGFDYRRSPLSSPPVGWATPGVAPPHGAGGGHMYGVYGHPHPGHHHPGGMVSGHPTYLVESPAGHHVSVPPYHPQAVAAPKPGPPGTVGDARYSGKDKGGAMGPETPSTMTSVGGFLADGRPRGPIYSGVGLSDPGRASGSGPTVSMTSSGVMRSALGSSSSDGETDVSLSTRSRQVSSPQQPNGFLKWAGVTRIGPPVHGVLDGGADLRKPSGGILRGSGPAALGKPSGAGVVRSERSDGSLYGGHGPDMGPSGSQHYGCGAVSHSHGMVTDSDNTGTGTGLGSTSCDDMSDGTATASALLSPQIVDTAGSIAAQRKAALSKFLLKRKERCFDKKVRYQSRKRLAEQRPRVRGQFVRKDAEIHD